MTKLRISKECFDQFQSGTDDRSCDENYALKIPYNRKYELAEGTFFIDENAKLGSGQMGQVFQGTIQSYPKLVAFKCTTSESSMDSVIGIMSEIKILSYLGIHENLVCILGAYTKEIRWGIVKIALELCPEGSLLSYLKNAVFVRHEMVVNDCKNMQKQQNESSEGGENWVRNKGYLSLNFEPIEKRDCGLSIKKSVNTLTLVRWAEQIASAMEYVSSKKVTHADLAARNVLLVAIDHVKVSDFGLSRKMYEQMRATHDNYTPLPWRWLAPESLKHLVFTSQSDVWAYGVTLWEIFSMGEVPYYGITDDMTFVHKLEKGMRLPMAKHATVKIHEKMTKCWKLDPASRPSFTELREYFHDLVSEYSRSHSEHAT